MANCKERSKEGSLEEYWNGADLKVEDLEWVD